MKVSIITVCLNSEETIKHSLNSVISQDYKNIEHIIIDGGSTDNTLKILKNYKFKKKRIFFEKGRSLYDSLNFGIKKCKGDLITILHSDDLYNNNKIITKVVTVAKNSKFKIFFGNVVYFNKNNFDKITRFYPAKIKREIFSYGNMPPHTGSFYKKEIFQKYGYYNKEFKIAGDFEHLFRLIFINKLNFKVLNFIITRMRTGGLSGKNLNSFYIINNEILKSFKINKIKTNFYKILLRIPPKVFQYIFLNQKELNKNFEITIDKSYENELYNRINIIQNIKNLNLRKNFVLSALNLSFMGSLSRGHVNLYKNLCSWPDGIFSKIYQKNLKKIPGRQVINDLKIDNNINRILVLGNLSKKGKEFLISRYNIKVVHKPLPFGSAEFINNHIKFKIKKNDLIFLTIPTPKQEQIAEYLKEKNKHYKIICIGGSIGIVAGDEKVVPKSLFYLEFLWRLRYETIRRTRRLFVTFYQYITDMFFYKKLNNIKIELIDRN